MSTVFDDLETMRLAYVERVGGMSDDELRAELACVSEHPADGESAAVVRDELRARRRPDRARRRTPHPAQIVRGALAASGGLGEPWWSDHEQAVADAVRVGNRLHVVETEGDLGWSITSYALPGDGGEAAPVAVVARDTDTEDAVRTLTKMIRQTGRPMVWRRVGPGLYRSGGFTVGYLDATGEWYAEGQGVDQVFDTKAAAQTACDRARGR